MHSAKRINRIISSTEIRKTFVDYFTLNHDHQFVRSSPLVPLCDPSLAFVNAGMNQFKSIFLGKSVPSHRRVANSQKCVRVGGKHNDLTVVGQDSYHHTFFEMLGNWSFGDYFKNKACEMALDLLCGHYNINPDRLFVTYFGGDEVLGLPADLECFEIWRSLGIPASRILPFGSKDNFWEMGTTGPCGPCTEIHMDLNPEAGGIERTKYVNGGRSDVIELWNLVFIQYNRNLDGSITELPDRHVDTGMGFERLTAILQNKNSNYDTDLFIPIFNQIQKVANVPKYQGCFSRKSGSYELDTGYRILGDHSRMLATCLADGMLPDQNHKLRRVLRKAQTISENVFSNNNLLAQLIPIVVETLGSAYPELHLKINSIQDVIAHEQEVFRAVRDFSTKNFSEVFTEFPELDCSDLMEMPGFIPAYRELKKQKYSFKNNTIPGSFLYKLTDTFGLTKECFSKLAEMEDMLLDYDGYSLAKANANLKMKNTYNNSNEHSDLILKKKIAEELIRITQELLPTDISSKYNYTYEETKHQYKVPTVTATVLRILLNDKEVTDLKRLPPLSPSDAIYIITNCSNFYYLSGGQQSDQGTISFSSSKKTYELEVVDVEFVNDCVVHACRAPKNIYILPLSVGTKIELTVNAEHRHLNTLHHTGSHILNEAVRSLFKKTTYQVSSEVNKNFFKLELGIIGKQIKKEEIKSIEDIIRKIISSATPVNVRIISALDVLQQRDITMIPGETYPDTNLRLIEIINNNLNFRSKELCCGTHILNTEHMQNLCITQVKQTSRARYDFTGVAGSKAKNVLNEAAQIEQRTNLLENLFKNGEEINTLEKKVQEIRNIILHTDLLLPHVFKLNTLERISDLLKQLREASRIKQREFVEYEMKNLLKEKSRKNNYFVVHYISSSSLLEEIPLQKATKFCQDRPVLVATMFEGIVKARCCVPKIYITQNFNAELWIKEFASVFQSQVSPPKGKNAEEVCNMKGKKVFSNFENDIDNAMLKANEYANEHCYHPFG